ncbi:hypothetical protein BMS3Abin04_02672 [bacterium BMS3Abin04]|nr:hypothetical protein BMS3Abin04_02672 [bacterium BMS3Abin04]
MKAGRIFTLAFLFLLLLTSLTTASSGSNKVTHEQIEKNLIVGVKSDNYGLRVSSAYFLGGIKSSNSVNHLLKLLHNGETEEERIIAALSLIKIQSSIGTFAVKRSAIFDDSERVRKICGRFYLTHIATTQNNSSFD